MEVGFVGQEVMAGDVAECVISLELANDQFDTSTVVVEAPEVERLQRQIGDQDLVVVAAELEQCQLLARLFGLWAANDHEATAAPPAGRLVAELGDLDAAARTGVAQVGEPALDGPGQARDDDKAWPSQLRAIRPSRDRKTPCRRGL